VKNFLLFLLFSPIILHCQDEKKRNGLKKLIQQAEQLAKDLRVEQRITFFLPLTLVVQVLIRLIGLL
jgi:hypothetical protein